MKTSVWASLRQRFEPRRQNTARRTTLLSNQSFRRFAYGEISTEELREAKHGYSVKSVAPSTCDKDINKSQ